MFSNLNYNWFLCKQADHLVEALPGDQLPCTPTTERTRSFRNTRPDTRRRLLFGPPRRPHRGLLRQSPRGPPRLPPRGLPLRPPRADLSSSRRLSRKRRRSRQRRLSARTAKSARCLSATATSAWVMPPRIRRPTRPRSLCPALSVADPVSSM
jgi:hypothetical protein